MAQTLLLDPNDNSTVWTTTARSTNCVNGDPCGAWDSTGSVAGVAVFAEGGFRPVYTTNAIGANAALDFDGSNDELKAYLTNYTTPQSVDQFFDANVFTVMAVIVIQGDGGNEANDYANSAIWVDSLQYVGGFHTTETSVDKLYGYNFDTNEDYTGKITVNRNETLVVVWRHTGNTLYTRVVTATSDTEQSIASNNTDAAGMAGQLTLGVSNPSHYNGLIGYFSIWDTGDADGDLENTIDTLVNRFIFGFPRNIVSCSWS